MLRASALTVLLAAAACGGAGALGSDQLYTGDALTVAPRHTQLQVFYNTAFKSSSRLAGTSLTVGVKRNLDARLSYGYLWNYRGPDVQIGPSAGVKWRFLGDGMTTSSLAVSCLYATNHSVGGRPKSDDFGVLLIVQQPVGHITVLANLGRVWVNGEVPDLHYYAFALARHLSPQALLAVEYVGVGETGSEQSRIRRSQYALGFVYHPRQTFSYSLQIGYAPDVRRYRWNATIGVSTYF